MNLICPLCDDSLGVRQFHSEHPDYKYRLEGGCVNCYTSVSAYIPTKKYTKYADALLEKQVKANETIRL